MKSTLFLEILRNISFDWTTILKKIKIKTRDRRIEVLSQNMNLTSETPIYPACKSIDIETYFDLQKVTPRQIFFEFWKVANLGVYVYIEDKAKYLMRPLKSSKLSYSGPSINNANLYRPIKQSLIIRQNIF